VSDGNRLRRALEVLRDEGPAGLGGRLQRRLGPLPRPAPATGRTCPRPWIGVTVHADGSVWGCCPDWVRFDLGRLGEQTSVLDLWNGRRARGFRAAVAATRLDRVCRSSVCPWIVSDRLPRVAGGRIAGDAIDPRLAPPRLTAEPTLAEDMEAGRTVLDRAPWSLGIAADPRCNLSCPSCRSELITRTTPAQDRVLAWCRRSLHELGPELRRLHMLGSGEFFASQFCLDLVRDLDPADFPRLQIDLLTNGTLLGDRTWRHMGAGASLIRSISVSIDAATPATYERVRRGATWDALVAGLSYLRDLRASGALDSTSINFVAAEHNFAEMPAFVELADRFGVDGVTFTTLQPWAGMDLAYKASAVHLPAHPRHGEYLEVLRHPTLLRPEVVVARAELG